MAESRRNLRISCSVPALLYTPESKPQESWGVIFDISLGGVKIETPRYLKRGENVFLSFVVGRKYHFKKMKGSILRVLLKGHTYEIGIKFDDMYNKEYMAQAIRSIQNYK
jgi:hypothetical protein